MACFALVNSYNMACFALVTSYNMACFTLVISHDMPSNVLHTPLYPPSVHMLCITWTQNMPRHDKVKIKGANGQTGGKHRSSSAFVLTAFISFGLFNIFQAKGALRKNTRNWVRQIQWCKIEKRQGKVWNNERTKTKQQRRLKAFSLPPPPHPGH